MNPATAVLPIVGGWATGVTPIVAFDAALWAAGVGDVNLVALSSIVPPGFQPQAVEARSLGHHVPLGFGDVVYSVVAQHRVRSGPAWAGIGWVTDAADRGGLFLEGHGDDPAVVRSELELGLAAMVDRRPQLDLGQPRIELVGGEAPGPSCAVMVAVVARWAVTPPTEIDLTDSPMRSVPETGSPPSPGGSPR